MATELGQAYVQIMPSAKGISGSIQKVIDPEATAAGKSAGGKIGLALKAGVAAAAAGLGAIIAGSIKQGADLEQSIGGIETLFKDSADTVRGYANEAYKTVGVSANDYMENVTSFSASLLQSMGGDTKEAAKVAHTAMVDMGDNANKMGTDMRDIQNAYQGFAKENYTMLDNLKLGYGGTKTEMERLLKDAQELTGVEYDISNLDDVFMAIHAIQQELDITGTTALEAEETISGSFNALKAAFTDVLGSLAIGENLNSSLNALADTFATFLFGNLIPMIGQIVSTLPGAIITLIQAAIPMIQEQGGALLRSLAQGVSTAMPELLVQAQVLMSQLILWLRESFPTILQNGVEFIINFANGLFQGMPSVISNIGQILNQILVAIFTAIPTIMQAGYNLIVGLAQGIWSNLPAIIERITMILSGLLQTILEHYPNIFKQGWSLIGQLSMGLWNNLPQIISTIGNIIGQLLRTIGSRYPELIRMGFDLIIWLGEGLVNAIPNIVRNVPQIVGAIVSTFSSLTGQFISIGADIVRGLWQGINSVKDWILGKISGFVDSITGGIKSFFGIKSPSTVMADEIGRWLPPGLAEGIEGNMSPVTKAMEDLASLTTGSFESEIAMNAVATGSSIAAVHDSGANSGIEITNNNYSPEPLTDREIARQTKLSLQKLGYNL